MGTERSPTGGLSAPAFVRSAPGQMILAGARATGDLGGHIGGQRQPPSCRGQRYRPVGQGPRADPMPARDRRLVPGRNAGQTVVVQHRSDSVQAQRSEDTMAELGDERGRRPPREWPVVAHKPPYAPYEMNGNRTGVRSGDRMRVCG